MDAILETPQPRFYDCRCDIVCTGERENGQENALKFMPWKCTQIHALVARGHLDLNHSAAAPAAAIAEHATPSDPLSPFFPPPPPLIVETPIETPKPESNGKSRQVFPVYLHGRSRKGMPVLWERIGKVDIPKADELKLPLADLTPNYVFLNECVWRLILDKGEDANDDAKVGRGGFRETFSCNRCTSVRGIAVVHRSKLCSQHRPNSVPLVHLMKRCAFFGYRPPTGWCRTRTRMFQRLVEQPPPHWCSVCSNAWRLACGLL